MAPTSLRKLLRSEASVSEVLGTVLLTATTVVLLGGFGVVLLSSVDDTNDPPSGAFSMDAEEGATTVDLRFVAGTPFRLEDADLLLLVNGTRDEGTSALVDPDVPGTFSPGGVLRFSLSSGALPPDANLRVLVVERESGKPIGGTVTTLLSASTLPTFVTGTPAISSVSFDPASLVVDGTSLANVTVQVASPFGLDLVRTVTLDLGLVGGAADVALLDDGQGADALAGDGIYSAQVAALQHDFLVTPSTETVTLPVTLRDVFGKVAQGDGTLSLETAPQTKVATGAKYRNLPPSGSVDYVNLTDLTYRDVTVLDNDQTQVRVSDLSGTSNVWTALVTFASPSTCGGGLPGVASVKLSRDGVSGSATFTPSSGCLSLGALSKLNIADPQSSLDATGATVIWSVSGSASAFLYSAAGIGETNEALVTFFGDSVSPAPSAVGLGGADLEWARFSGEAPTASFTASTTLLTANVDASASVDRRGEGLTYDWDWGDGTTSTGGPTMSHLYASAGTYLVTLTVTDGADATATTSASVTPNRPPTASFSASTLLLGVSVDSTASGDPDGHAISRSWAWGDGQTQNGGVTATHTYASSGTYTILLTVTDSLGASATTSSTVTVTAANVAPVAGLAAAPTSGTAPLSVSFTLTGTDADGTVASWSMDYGDGSTETGTTLPASRSRAYAAGTYQATLTVIDDDGATDDAVVTLSVAAPNGHPTATLSSNVSSGHAPLDVGFTLAGTDADGTIASWTLTFGDGTQTTGATLPATASRQYAAAGAYLAHLHVVDDDGAVAGSSVNITANARPVASFVVTGTSGLQASVDAGASSDADGSIAQYAWDWGDGLTSTGGPTTSHTYATGGTYVITLTVTDDDGATSAGVTQQAAVNRAPSITSVSQTSADQLNATLATTASDPDGQALSYTYAWGDATNVSVRGATPTAIHTYARPGNYTVTVYANDTMGGSAFTTTTVQATSNLYALLNLTAAGTPSGTATNPERIQALDGSSMTLTEATGSGASYTQPSTACDSTFDGCTTPGSWVLVSGTFQPANVFTGGSTLSGGTSGTSLVLHNSGGADALQFATYKTSFTVASANPGAAAGTFTMGYKFETTTAGQKVNMVLVAPNGAVTNLSTSTTVTGAWTAFPTATVPSTVTSQAGTFTLFANVTVQKNREVYLDDVKISWADAPAYRLQQQVAFTGLPTGSGLSYHLEVTGVQGVNAETLGVQVEQNGAWVARANLTSTSTQTVSYKLSAADLQGDMVRIRLVDPAGTDVTQTTWSIDSIRIVVRGGTTS